VVQNVRPVCFSISNALSNVTTLDELPGVDAAPLKDLLLLPFHYFRLKAATAQPYAYHAIRIYFSMILRSSRYTKRNCVIGAKTFPHRHCQVTVACDYVIGIML
jgi:hypothetical protein